MSSKYPDLGAGNAGQSSSLEKSGNTSPSPTAHKYPEMQQGKFTVFKGNAYIDNTTGQLHAPFDKRKVP